MDFRWTDEQRAFRQRVRDILKANLPSDWDETTEYDNGGDVAVAFSRTFCPLLASEGLLVPHWPTEYGGGGASPFHHWILNEEMWAIGEPRSYQYMSVNWVGPAIIRYGTPAQKDLHLARIRAGTVYYCQGFSEPNAGSDLAALQTRAERTEAGYVINGQKVWTSAAGFADYCILLVRTGGERRHGISVMIVPMTTPGITVRRIPGLQGKQSLNEVFFDNVVVPADSLLGEENKGWDIITAILANERIGAPRYALTIRGLDRAIKQLTREGRYSGDVTIRAGRCFAALESARLQAYRVIDGRVKGRTADTDTNMARYAGVVADRLMCEFLADFLPHAIISGDDPVISAAYKRTAAIGIAAGAAEIQLGLIARNNLDLPTK